MSHALPRQEPERSNRFLGMLSPHDVSLLARHLRIVALERGAILHDVGEEIERVYFPHSGMVSLVAVTPDGRTVETATVGRAGIIGASAGLGARLAVSRAIMQLSGTAAWISAAQFHAVANQSQAIRDLIVRYNDLLLGQVQQSVACNALHSLETRLCSRLLQTHDCAGGEAIPLTQESLGQMLGVRRTTVTIAARLLQNSGLIRYRRGRIQILDRAGLEDISCECYAVVRQNADKVFSGVIYSRAEEVLSNDLPPPSKLGAAAAEVADAVPSLNPLGHSSITGNQVRQGQVGSDRRLTTSR
jgi:CRP-like cAMP-binding protein